MAADKPRLCRTDEECEQAGRERIRRSGRRLTQREMERCLVLLRPYADQLIAEVADTRPHPADEPTHKQCGSCKAVKPMTEFAGDSYRCHACAASAGTAA
jgi:hypothetical protein